jgi:2,4'-dihydroxyacetophenone dioxygenase
MTTVDVPTAVHIGAEELPFVDIGDGSKLKVLQVKEEYDYVNRAGSFLYEPAGSVHTLQAIEDDTHVWFQMYGANLNLDADGNVESVVDGALTLAAYYMLCEAEGLPRPNVLVG